MLRSALLAFGLALAAAGSASAVLVARGVQDGMLSLGPKGTREGWYAFVDRSPVEPLVYTDPQSGIPYAALLRPAAPEGPDWPGV